MNTMTLAIIIAVYVILNIVAALFYVYDKAKAQNQEWRVRESTLLLVAFFGPFGATIAMQKVRHKTQKPKFKLVYLFLVIHICVIAYLIIGRVL